MTISIAQLTDLSRILALQKQCYQSEAELYQDFQIPPLVQDQTSIEMDFYSGAIFLKAVIENEIVGSVKGKQTGKSCHIGRLIVDPSFQNRRIGTQLMEAIESHFNKCSRFELFTGHKSDKNLYLYKKLDYQPYKEQVVSEKLILVYLEKFNTT